MNKSKILVDIMITVALIGFLRILPNLNIIDKRLSYLFIFSLIVYYTGRLTSITKFFEIFHVLFAFCITTFPFLTKNRDILFLHLVGIILTMATRKLFNKCLLRDFEKNDNIITNNSLSKSLNWDYIFPSLALSSSFKMYMN